MALHYRTATVLDIPHLHHIRLAVKENVLSRPDLVTHNDYKTYLTTNGKGWVCEQAGKLLGFSIVDIPNKNVWALFIHPDHEGLGIGKQLHNTLLDWYFASGENHIWLSTSPNTRAEAFYRKLGWQETGSYGKGEIKFEMTASQWQR